MANDNMKDLIDWDAQHVVHAMCPVGQNIGWLFDKGQATTFKDTDGRVYIDGLSQLTSLNLGHGRKEIVQAMKEQLDRNPYCTHFFGMSDPSVVKCAQKLAELLPRGMDHFAFTTGGSESVETALRLARLYWHNRGTSKFKIISLHDSYHGITFGALSAVGLGKGIYSRGVNPLVPGFLHIPSYNCYHCAFGKEYPGCGIQCARFLAYTIEREDPETVAAFIAEPVQGAGGNVVPPAEFWPMVREICTEKNILLITDEVMTGFCRTGKMFAMEHWSIEPDMMALAKGITGGYFPFGALVLNERVFAGLRGSVIQSLTYSGHPVGAAAAIKAMEIYVEEEIAQNTATVGAHVLERLNSEFLALPHVGCVSAIGLMIGVEIVADKATKKPYDPSEDVTGRIVHQAAKEGLYMRAMPYREAAGDRCELAPPLISTVEELDRELDILYRILSALG